MTHWFPSSRRALRMALMLTALTAAPGCQKDPEEAPLPQLAGTPGNPRFNLQFTNEENVDLDLYVKTPNGTIIYWNNSSGQGGELDVDCNCFGCSTGPNENIYWVPGTAPTGTYQFWVKYFDKCGTGSNATSDYTLRVINGNNVLESYTGTLSATQPMSAIRSKSY